MIESRHVVYNDGVEEWVLPNGLRHRIDGPAFIGLGGTEAWYHLGRHHRIDGPAITFADGTSEWWLNGRRVDPLVHFLERNENGTV